MRITLVCTETPPDFSPGGLRGGCATGLGDAGVNVEPRRRLVRPADQQVSGLSPDTAEMKHLLRDT